VLGNVLGVWGLDVRDSGAYQLAADHENRCVVVTEAGSYLRLIDFCITQLKAQGPSRTCNESKEEEEEITVMRRRCMSATEFSMAHVSLQGQILALA